jgi:hypothetical protein
MKGHYILTCCYIPEVNCDPVRSTFAQSVAHSLAIIREPRPRQCHSSVFRQLIWVEEDFWLSIQRVLHVQNTNNKLLC